MYVKADPHTHTHAVTHEEAAVLAINRLLVIALVESIYLLSLVAATAACSC